MTDRSGIRGVACGAILMAAVLLPIVYAHVGDLNRQIGLERDAREAQADTTRRVVLGMNELAKGVITMQRRVVQQEIPADKLDHALGLKTTAKGSIDLALPPIHVIATTETKNDVGGVRLLEFRNVRDTLGAAVINADITVPPAPETATGVFHIVMNPIALNFRLGCGPKNRANNGVRPAQLSIFGPEYLHISMANLQQEPAVCNPRERNWATDWRTLSLATLLLVVGLRH